MALLGILYLQMTSPNIASAEDGSKLWLRYSRVGDATLAEHYRASIREVVVQGTSPAMLASVEELRLALPSMLGGAVKTADSVTEDGAIVLGTMESSAQSAAVIKSLNWSAELMRLGSEGFLIRSCTVSGHHAIAIASSSDIGVLYGTFHLLRLIQTGQSIDQLDIAQSPKLKLRILDHWDNLDGSIERGYAGKSLWQWDDLPEKLSPRYKAYARAMASIGLNGAVLNNVNANAKSLSADYLPKAAALADVFRRYGVRVYLSANFAAPKTLGKLASADPLDPAVAKWWKAKADEIYKLIPDFGGFVMKANSEGQPGPQDYHRTHADGANVIADAVAPHGGIIMWRAFVYDEKVDPDRAKRAYLEFTALDGKFRPNVMVQVKNGAIDFQPREPFHPLFGAMKQTPVMAELQVTQEYLGFSNHLVYLAPMWKEFLDSDTFAHGQGTLVSKTIDGICAVANTGDDTNWCGHHFAQANWYAFGRLAWDSSLPAEQIADEWLRMTWSADAKTRDVLRAMMLQSWETFISYSMPLGLHHLISANHYAPAPWNGTEPREDWTAVYYHRADSKGVGFDRTMRGNGAVGQYFPPVRDQFDDVQKCPEKLLLWFHRLPWDYRMKSGRTLWDELCVAYANGSAHAAAMEATWQSLSSQIDPQRFREVATKLKIQADDAHTWRDKCLRYFQGFSDRSIPSVTTRAAQ
jgi:alpha-glucuronidase